MRGIGTVINREIVNLTSRLDLKFEYNELIRAAGYTPHSDSISLRSNTPTRSSPKSSRSTWARA